MAVLGVLHTVPVTIQPLKELAGELLPDVRVISTLDDSLLIDVIRQHGLTGAVIRRIALLCINLEDAGADLILDACSSIGEAVEAVQPMLEVPILRIDQAMAEKAVEIGGKIAVLATVSSTMEPTVRLLERTAAATNDKNVEVDSHLISGAYDALIGGREEEHDRLVRNTLADLYDQDVQAIVLAQASMARVAAQLPDPTVPVLTSPRLAMERVAQQLS